MTDLDVDAFSNFVEAVHGYRPFRWQRRLLARLIDGEGWPSLLDLPTGSGKTSVIDVAVFGLAASATTGRRALPRRIVFVVDRRVIVDQAADHARRLVDALAQPDGPHVGATGRDEVRAVAMVLAAHVGGDGDRPLHLSVLRGGLPRDGSWALRPDQATVMVSTVDQVGSRLLFNGYGVSDGMAPVHAGLLGTDALFLLDEVHLSRPFAQTLRTVGAIRPSIDGPAPLTVVELSATPGDDSDAEDTFALEDEDLDPAGSPELVRRLTAPRRANIMEVKGKEAGAAVVSGVMKALDALDGDTHAVVVNRVATATAVHRSIVSDRPDDLVVLLTGRMRPLDRDDVLREHAERLRAGRSRRASDDVIAARPRLIVVATQTIEAGADFDFDGLITELAPIDSLRQRFGRLDRLGRAAEAGITPRAVIIAPRVTLKAREPDPVYGTAAVAAHEWLREQFGADDFDVSPSNEVLGDPPATTLAPAEQAPLLLPHHVDLLTQTSPRPGTQPPVELWLHGPRDVDLDVTVVWRADIRYPGPSAADAVETTWDDVMPGNRVLLELAPPAPGEAMPVQVGRFRDWATERGANLVVRSSRQAPAELAAVAETPGVRSISPGDTVIVPASWGGIAGGNWSPAAMEPVPDRGLDAILQQRRRVVVRLVEGALPEGCDVPPDLDPLDETVGERIYAWLGHPVWQGWLDERQLTAPVRPSDLEIRWPFDGEESPYAVVSWWPRISEPKLDALHGLLRMTEGGDNFDGSDEVHSFTASGVTLASHGQGVGQLAAAFAARCHLRSELQADLQLAGELHDLGKGDPRFQRMLHGGWRGAWLPGQPQLAKSSWGHPGDPEARRARERSGYPSGTRHEVTSVALVESIAEVSGRAHDWDLVLHLVATHHGWCRPLAPAVPDRDPVDVHTTFEGLELSTSSAHGLEDLGAGIPDRYWRVQRRYGPWGTAFLEAVLRLADHRRSQHEQEQSR